MLLGLNLERFRAGMLVGVSLYKWLKTQMDKEM
ncbi:hypothetical protein BleG1_3951 [Shouchella lehensis G1]|uniref:Uncharacterized protein n=1 Tax=Shouchella lehensis G1 TaxID=1246626 RepID=A0A060M7H3_9BACI|nr:hypothetical protein BleG1_3951 [Shouchella lehensis G1]